MLIGLLMLVGGLGLIVTGGEWFVAAARLEGGTVSRARQLFDFSALLGLGALPLLVARSKARVTRREGTVRLGAYGLSLGISVALTMTHSP